MELKQKVSITGLRTLNILDILLKSPASKKEILDILINNPYLKNITQETIALDINTLKSAGFEIENLGKKENYRYKINWNPIKFKLTKSELNVLRNMKNAVIELLEPVFIIKLYKLFEKITKYIENEAEDELMNFQYFLNIDFELFLELYALTKRKKDVKILYDSPHTGKKEIQIKLKEIKYNNSKLYLTGFCSDYPNITVLRVDNIIRVIKILKPNENINKAKIKTVCCKIKPAAKEKMNLLNEEKIILENKNFIKIELKFDNDFMIIQRLLSYGEDLISIKNKDIKEKYLLKLAKIEKIYEGKE